MPTITAFRDSPDRGRGLARDTRVRWALEEVGAAYDVRLVSFQELKEIAHLSLNPFGQIPTFQDGAFEMFESGAIVLHIAELGRGLLPSEPGARARAIMWMFAALNTVEPPILELETARLLESAQPWTTERLPILEQRIERRLDQLSTYLSTSDWLDGDFAAGDLMMGSVLMRLRSSRILEAFPRLVRYVADCEARPAYQKAFAAQLEVYTESLRGQGRGPGKLGQ